MSYYYQEPEWDPAYDSTWEDEILESPKAKKQKSQYQRNYGSRAARDMQNYRHEYGQTNQDNDSYQAHQDYMPNLDFYRNKILFQPYGVTIEEFHKFWRNDYEELEGNHGFIQWLFPLREPGMNSRAVPLTTQEMQMMKTDPDVRRRLLESYKIMLGFYGICLLNEETGEVCRAKNWRERYHNLNNHSHNNLRITRILKCLGELGYEHLQAPLVRFFLEETLCNDKLHSVERSVLDYFMFTVRNKQERKKLVKFAYKHRRPQRPFIWGPADILQSLITEEEEDKKETRNTGREEKLEEEEKPDHEPERTAGDGDVAFTDDATNHTGGAHNEDLQQPETGDGLKTEGDDGGDGVDRDDDDPGKVSEPEDAITSSRNKEQKIENSSGSTWIMVDNRSENERPITGDNNSGNEGQITEENSSENEEQIRETKSSGSEEQTTENNSSGDKLIAVGDNLGSMNQVREGNDSGNEELITEDNSSGNGEQIPDSNNVVNDTQTTEGNSSGDAEPISEGNSSGDAEPITEGNSSGDAELITEGNSSGDEEPITEGNSSGDDQLIKGRHLGNENFIREGTISENEEQITEDNSSLSKNLIREDTSTGNEGQITESDSSLSKNLIREHTSTGNEGQITENTGSVRDIQTAQVIGLGSEQITAVNRAANGQTTENTSFINPKTPADTSIGHEPTSYGHMNMTTGGTSLEKKPLLTQTGEPDNPTYGGNQVLELEEKDMDAPKQNGRSDYILSLCDFCCFICCCTRHT